MLAARVAAVAVILALVAGCVASPVERAKALSRQGRDEEGIVVLRKRLAIHPADVEARKLLIRLLAVLSDRNAVQAEVLALERALPAGDPTPSIELGHAFELMHQFEEALGAYDQAAALAPASPVGPREGGIRCARWGEAEEARPRLEEAVRRGARDAETYHTLGLVLLKLGDVAAAEAAYRAGIAVEPRGPENWLGLATVAVTRRDFGLALFAYDRILKLVPTYGAAELGRAWALARLGRAAEATRALDHAQDLGAPQANIDKQRAALAHPPAGAAAPSDSESEGDRTETSPAAGPGSP